MQIDIFSIFVFMALFLYFYYLHLLFLYFLKWVNIRFHPIATFSCQDRNLNMLSTNPKIPPESHQTSFSLILKRKKKQLLQLKGKKYEVTMDQGSNNTWPIYSIFRIIIILL